MKTKLGIKHLAIAKEDLKTVRGGKSDKKFEAWLKGSVNGNRPDDFPGSARGAMMSSSPIYRPSY